MILLSTSIFAALLAATTPISSGSDLSTASPADLTKACNSGNGAACTEMGNRYRLGLGVIRSDVRASDLFKKACAAKDPDGCADDAAAMGLGLGQKRAPDIAVMRLDKQCKSGLPRACGNLAILYLAGLGGADNKTRAEGMLEDACRKGDLEACSNESTIAWHVGNDQRFEKFGRASCDNGYAEGCANLADVYLAQKDLLHATANYARACQLSSVRACTSQGLLLLQAGADRQHAISLLDQSCKLGDGKACDAIRQANDAAHDAGKKK
jgi:TPR repeat protein